MGEKTNVLNCTNKPPKLFMLILNVLPHVDILDLKITVGYLKVAIPVKGNANVFIGWKFEII